MGGRGGDSRQPTLHGCLSQCNRSAFCCWAAANAPGLLPDHFGPPGPQSLATAPPTTCSLVFRNGPAPLTVAEGGRHA